MTEIARPERVAKIAELRAQGIDPYPARGWADAKPCSVLREGIGTPEQPGELWNQPVRCVGRAGAMRDFGRLTFFHLHDRDNNIQVSLEPQYIEDVSSVRSRLDQGDIVGVEGKLGRTRKGEATVFATRVELLAKCVASPPEKWHGLTDKEERYRRRYVDLWAGPGVAAVFKKRSRIVSWIRKHLEDLDYLEVETPTLHPIAGGAAARPFVTHHNALGMNLFLRIAPELYLKRCIVGGLERVFEFSRNFRNEGLSQRHNPEFTMLELYEAQADYRRMIEIFERIVSGLAEAICGTTKVLFRGVTYDLAAPFEKRRYMDLFREHAGCEFHDRPAVLAKAEALKLDGKLVAAARTNDTAYFKLANDVYEAVVEEHLAGPIFVLDYPIEISPLAKASPSDPRVAERLELFVGGMELGNGFSELNDPAEQMRRFEEQVASKDPEAPGEVDVDYVQALEYGMPPTAGLGIGIDRLVMVLCNQDSIRDVLLFPAMRPRAEHDAQGDGQHAAGHAPTR